MNDIFDIFAAVKSGAAAFFKETGIAPAICSVSREIYRLLVEQNAVDHAIGNLIIASYPVTSIVSDNTNLRVVIDERLSGWELSIE